MIKLFTGLFRQRVTIKLIESQFKKANIGTVIPASTLLTPHIYSSSICSLYFNNYSSSKRFKGLKKSKMDSPRSSPEIVEILKTEKTTKQVRKTVAENLRDNVRKWEATQHKIKPDRSSSSSSTSPEVVHLSNSVRGNKRGSSSTSSDDVEVIEVVPIIKPKPRTAPMHYKALYSSRCPLTRRNWQDTPLATRIRRNGLPKSAFPFSIMSYNILAQDLLEQHPHLYQYHNLTALEWSVRHIGIIREIKHHLPDIICLQEVQASHADQFFMQPLSSMGYEGVFKQRTGNKVDGCAIFWQRGKFELVEQTSVEYYQPGVDLLNRDNIGLIVRLKVKGSIDEIVVASTHLLYNPRRADVRLAQMQLLLAELDRVSHNGLPVLLTGDFNLQPDASVYELLLTGQVNIDSRFGLDCVPSYLGITDCCRHSSILSLREESQYSSRNVDVVATELTLLQLHHTERKSEVPLKKHPPSGGHKFGTGTLSHTLKLQSVYEHNPNIHNDTKEATTYQDGWVTVDYIFHSVDDKNTGPNSRSLNLLSCWSLPTVAECRVLGPIPNFDAPSDHLPLVACFVLI